MQPILHSAIYVSDGADQQLLIENLLEGKFSEILPKSLKGVVFSSDSLQYFIDEELKHGRIAFGTTNNPSLAQSSSGEQRKAFLNFLFTSHPKYIILSNVFDSLDVEARNEVLNLLTAYSSEIIFIQLIGRKNEVLPFITNSYRFDNETGSLILTNFPGVDEHSNARQPSFNTLIPASISPSSEPCFPLIKFTDVSVSFNERRVLDKINWEVNPGEFWQLKGPNGSGKSTLLSLITGNSVKGYGQNLVLFGKQKGSGESVWELKQQMGYYAPSITMHFDRMDSIEQMIVGGFYDSIGLYIQPTDRQTSVAQQWLLLLHLEKVAATPFRLAPAITQRMVMIARAMVKHPPLLILDEPTAGLDDQAAELFTALINKIASETTTAILYVSHKTEPGLFPKKIYQLVPGNYGSTGQILL